MKILHADVSMRDEWDRFVETRPEASHHHLYGWKQVIEQTYRQSCDYLAAVDNGRILGVLPLAFVQTRLFGRSMTSLPYLDSAGLASDTAEASQALVDYARELTRSRGAGYLEIRQTWPLESGFRIDTHKVSLQLSVQRDPEAQWGQLSSERRNRVRKAQKGGLSTSLCGEERLHEFYDVWSRNMRDLGSPAHSVAWFRNVLQTFPDRSGLLLVDSESRAVGASVWLEFKGTLSVPWVSSLRSEFARHPNDLLYWAAVEAASQRGHARFDFGRSTRSSGNFTYKQRWGAEAQPLYWHYDSAEAQARLPTEERWVFRLAVALWKRLPVRVANGLGPRLRRGITS